MMEENKRATIAIDGNVNDVEQRGDSWYIIAGRGYIRILVEQGITDQDGRILEPERYDLTDT